MEIKRWDASVTDFILGIMDARVDLAQTLGWKDIMRRLKPKMMRFSDPSAPIGLLVTLVHPYGIDGPFNINLSGTGLTGEPRGSGDFNNEFWHRCCWFSGILVWIWAPG